MRDPQGKVPHILILAWGSAITLLAASVQSTIGFGFAVVSVPLLLLADPSLAPVPQLLLSIPLAIAIAWRERRSIDLRGGSWLLVGLTGGSMIGLVALKALNETGASLAVGAAVLVLVSLIHSGWKPILTTSTLIAGGLLSGVTSMLASMGGPPIALIYHRQPGAITRPTVNVVFLVGLLMALILRTSSAEIELGDLWLTLQLLPSMAVGFWAGGRFLRRFDHSMLQHLTLWVASVGAVLLIVSSSSSLFSNLR